ncbi:hypothetical protein WJX84_012046 [Apatococcus fuscideae]
MPGAVSALIRSGSTGSTADPNQSSETSKASQPNSDETSTPGPEGDDRIQDPGSETKTPTGDDESRKDSVSVVKMTGGLATLFQERDLGAEAQLLPLDPLGVRKPAVKSTDPRAVLEALRIPPGKLVHLSTDEYTGI